PVFNAYGYGMGWLIGTVKDKPMINHLGGYIGYKASISVFPDDGLGVAVFTNHQELGRPLGLAISDFVNELYFGEQNDMDNIEHMLLSGLEERVDRARRSEDEERKEWGNPEWDLSVEKEKYAGQFYNSLDGTLAITYDQDVFTIQNGNLKTIGEPHNEKDCFQVELIDTSRKVICFQIENEEVVSLQFRDKEFKKIK
ncbi:MAG: hypothetical protein AAFY41_04170, partial [Bacteroidota bacterium]